MHPKYIRPPVEPPITRKDIESLPVHHMTKNKLMRLFRRKELIEEKDWEGIVNRYSLREIDHKIAEIETEGVESYGEAKELAELKDLRYAVEHEEKRRLLRDLRNTSLEKIKDAIYEYRGRIGKIREERIKGTNEDIKKYWNVVNILEGMKSEVQR